MLKSSFLAMLLKGGEVKPITAKVDALNNFLVPGKHRTHEIFLGITDVSARTSPQL